MYLAATQQRKSERVDGLGRGRHVLESKPAASRPQRAAMSNRRKKGERATSSAESAVDASVTTSEPFSKKPCAQAQSSASSARRRMLYVSLRRRRGRRRVGASATQELENIQNIQKLSDGFRY